ncbi:MAG: flippase-like domain-containing protein, partial [Deltaproteobacteria bacterium]|nr:flippase-like domain-containing protein [Deltaproteobacteria bacterium]
IEKFFDVMIIFFGFAASTVFVFMEGVVSMLVSAGAILLVFILVLALLPFAVRAGRSAGWEKKRLFRQVSLLSDGLSTLTPGTFLFSLLATVASYILLVAICVLTLAMFGLRHDFASALLVVSFTGLSLSIPSVGGGLGNVHFFTIEALGAAGIAGGETALAFAVAAHLLNFIFNLIVGGFMLFRERKHL